VKIRSLPRSLALASLGAFVFVASGLEIRCDGATAQSRPTLAGLQTAVDLLGVRVALLEASASGYQLKGFSAQTVRGDGGVLTMSSACAASFPGSRMCTSREILDTTNVPVFTNNNDAWVRPTHVEVATGGNVTAVALDESGVSTPNTGSSGASAEDLSCRGWIASANLGLVVSDEGSFRLVACNANRPVACCGP
jgi:hypothetical protein